MADFDIVDFENQVAALLAAYQRQVAENRSLRQEYQALSQRNAETAQRLLALVDRLRALETEAEAQQP